MLEIITKNCFQNKNQFIGRTFVCVFTLGRYSRKIKHENYQTIQCVTDIIFCVNLSSMLYCRTYVFRVFFRNISFFLLQRADFTKDDVLCDEVLSRVDLTGSDEGRPRSNCVNVPRSFSTLYPVTWKSCEWK